MDWVGWIREPQHRFRGAVIIFFGSLVLWPATHIGMLITDPPENSWVFHVLLAISWLAITLTALDIIINTDIRKEQDSGSE